MTIGSTRTLRTSRRVVRKAVGAIGSRLDERLPQLRRRLTSGLTVFVFHDVTEVASEYLRRAESYTSPQVFKSQILWIHERFSIIRPPDLQQLGGDGELPANAALITFDDSWAGVFRTALPMLEALRVPSLCFLNMATVAGDPDISAVRMYERLHHPGGGGRLEQHVDQSSAPAILKTIRDRYGSDTAFSAFQGTAASPDDLRRAADGRGEVWFGSHLYHHWDVPRISAELFRQSLEENKAALDAYPNSLPILATPHGYAGGDDTHTLTLPRELGYRAVCVGTGRQNRANDAYVIDRLGLPPEPSDVADWWYAAHRRRVVGSLAS